MMKLFGIGGSKKKKIFGTPLETVSAMAPPEANGIPLPVFRGIQYIEKKHLEAEGIYRVSGAMKFVDQLIKLYDSGQDPDLNKFDPYVVSGIVKRFLTMLPNPLMTFDLHDKFVAAQRQKDKELRRNLVLSLLQQLPKLNKDVFCFLIKHLKKVTEFKGENKMGPSNIAIVFGPTLFRSRDNDAYRMLEETGHLSGLVQSFLNDFDSFFPEGGNLAQPSDNVAPISAESAPAAPSAPSPAALQALEQFSVQQESYKARRKASSRAPASDDPASSSIHASSDNKNRKSLLVGIHGEAVESMDVNSILQGIATQNETVDANASVETVDMKKLGGDDPAMIDNAPSVAPMSPVSGENNDMEEDLQTCVSVAVTSPQDGAEEASLRQFSLQVSSSLQEQTLDSDLAVLQEPYDLNNALECSQKRLEYMRNKQKRPEEINMMNAIQLNEEHKCLKKELKHFEKQFEAKFLRGPSKDEKAALRPLYKRYQQVKKRIQDVAENPSLLPPATPSKLGADESLMSDNYISPYSPLNKLMSGAVQNDASSPMKNSAFARRKSILYAETSV